VVRHQGLEPRTR